MSEALEQLTSWGRYLFWAELRQRDWARLISEPPDNTKGERAASLGAVCYFAASLYVVVEGWKEANFTDPVIDATLQASNYKDSLRILRNSTFHYQPSILSPKMTQFFQSPDVTLWLFFLHEEFCRWLRDYVDKIGRLTDLTPEQLQTFRDSCIELFGWLPAKPAEEKLGEFKKLCVGLARRVDASDTSKEACDLRTAIDVYDTVAKETAESVRGYRRGMLAKFGLEPNNYIP